MRRKPKQIPEYSGIYMIKNKINEKIYIGSALNLRKRFGQHKKKRGLNKYLKNARNKYSDTVFDFIILIRCAPGDCILYEQMFLDMLQPFKERGYNIKRFASFRKNSREFNEYLSQIKKGWTKKEREEQSKKTSLSMKRYWAKKNPGERSKCVVCGRNAVFFLSLCKDCVKKYGGKSLEWPEWLRFLINTKQKEIRKERNIKKHEILIGIVFDTTKTNVFIEIPRKEEEKIVKVNKKVITSKSYPSFIGPDKTIYPPGQNRTSFCRKHKLDVGALGKVIRSKREQHKGFRVNSQ